MPRTSRRSFLEIAGLLGGGVLLRRSLLGEAQAQTADPKFLLLVYFSGGWDQLLALDPRDALLPQYKFALGKALEDAGFTDIYNVTDGFEGPLDDDHRRGTAGGWRHAGLPWEQC